MIIFGFKSFADKTSLDFLHRTEGGVTAIVGPNGCGKSNVADSVRWVVGEKSAKSIRSPAMTDVIFSGTTKRKPLNYTEVTLVLTDVGDALETEYDEIAITRRLHRSGESQYMINKNTVRLKDIEDLLAGTGIGKNSMAIIAQGKVEEVVHCNPVERRSIIEEVAGTSLFIRRRDETRRKLQRTQDNLTRILDIKVEVEKQMKTAERQAQKALVYREKAERLEELDKSHLISKWQRLHSDSQKLGQQKATLEEEINETAETLARKEKELSEARAFHQEREGVLLAKSESLYKVKNERDLEAQAIRVRDEKLQEADARKEALIAELSEVEDKIVAYEKERELFEAQKGELDLDLEKEQARLDEEKEKAAALEQEVAALRDQQMSAQKNRMELLQKESQVEGEWKQTKLRCDHFHEKRQLTKQSLEDMKEALLKMREITAQKQKDMDDASKAVDAKKASLTDAGCRVQTCQEDILTLQESLSGVERELSEAAAQNKVLLNLKEEMQGFSSSTKKLMKESKKSGTPISGKLQSLSEVFTLDERLPKALTVALRPYAQTLVVETVGDFVTVLRYARQQQLKDFSLLCLEHVAPEGQSLPLLPNEELPKLTRHFLGHIHVAETPESVFKLGNRKAYQFCTEDSAFVDTNSVVFYPGKEENNAFVREAELKTLKKKLQELEEAKQKLCGDLAQLKQKRDELAQKKAEDDKALRQEEMRLVEVNFSLQRGLADLKKMEQDKERLEKEVASHETTINDLSQKLATLSKKHEETKKIATETHEMNSTAESVLTQKSETLTRYREALREQEKMVQSLLDKKKELAYHLQVVTMRLQEGKQQILKLQKGIEQCQVLLSEQEQRECDQDSLKKKDDMIEAISKSVDEERAKVAICKTQIETLDFETGQKRHQEKELIEKKNQIEIRLSQVNSTSEALAAELEERYQMAMGSEACSAIPMIDDLAEAEKELKTLRREIEKLGPVNMEAIEEKDEHAKRYDFLTQQVKDLESSMEELNTIIEELEQESRKLYEETFYAVQENFRKNFAILFRGGEADLRLVGSDDVLEAGIEIIAKPPGKQMRSITLLSGGEKCMTALAFLFAIFEVKPSPFCILDEIDAPLDDSNIQRFVDVLQQFTEKCQFIIITHNKRTMAIADTIYGVTMQEKGVSKLLSLEFQKNKEIAEPTLVESGT